MLAACCTLVLAGALDAQSSARNCPTVNGIVVTVGDSATRAEAATGGTGPAASTPRQGAARPDLRLDSRALIDTTWRFDIAERRWQRPSYSASIGAGWTSRDLARGMSSAPDTAGRRGLEVCAAVAVGMREPTLVLRGVKGVVRLRADVSALARGSRGSDTTSVPRR